MFEERDDALDFLISFDGTEHRMQRGYLMRILAHKINPTPRMPHGISYKLSLFDREGTRVLAYENGHSHYSGKRGRIVGRKTEWDHSHSESVSCDYEFESCEKLIQDFWDAVNQRLELN